MTQFHIENLTASADPTATGPLRALMDDTLANNKIRRLITSIKSRKIGLVLSGGGAKGAYQAGVMLALFDCGIRNFSSIAGTSVGGLNAALCHEMCRLEDRDLVLRIWGGLTRKSVLVLYLGTIVKILSYTLQSVRIIHDVEKFQKQMSVLSGNDLDPELDSLPSSLINFLRLTGICLVSLFVIVMVAGCIISFFFFIARPFLIDTLSLTPPTGSAVSIILVIIVFLILPKLAKFIGSRFGLFSNTPLRRTIEALDIDEVCDGKPPVICTLAGRNPRGIHRDTITSNIFRPSYVPLTAMQRQQAVDVLVQTAAIPEVFPLRNVFGSPFVDGGVVDNIPIFGVYQQRPDILFVVYLDHKVGRFKDLPFRERLRRLEPIVRNLGGNDKDEAMNWVRAIKMIPIIPCQPLGGFFCGTLNFKREKVQQLIALGYGDTLRQLSKVAKKTFC